MAKLCLLSFDELHQHMFPLTIFAFVTQSSVLFPPARHRRYAQGSENDARCMSETAHIEGY